MSEWQPVSSGYRVRYLLPGWWYIKITASDNIMRGMPLPPPPKDTTTE